MQKLIAKYGLAAHLSILLVAPLFLSPEVVLWLSPLALLWLFMEPSQIGGEILHEARHRVWKMILEDPLTWVLVALVAYAGLRALNTGVALDYDAEKAAWFVSDPKWQALPGVGDERGFPEFASAVAMLPVSLACRHAIGRSARYAVFFLSSLLAGSYALVLAYLQAQGDAEILRLSSCLPQDSSYLGAIFGMFFLGALGGALAAVEMSWYRTLPFAIFALCGTLLGLMLYAPPRTQVVFISLALAFFVYALVYSRKCLPMTVEFRYLMITVVAFSAAGALAFTILTPQAFADRVAPYLNGDFLPAEFLRLRSRLSEFALQIWRERPWLGGGLGSFQLHLGFLATEADWQFVPSLQRSPLNGYWCLLSERGSIGAFLVAAPLMMFFTAYVRRLVDGVRGQLPHPNAWIGFLTLVAALVDLLTSASCLEPAALLVGAACLSLSTSTFQKKR